MIEYNGKDIDYFSLHHQYPCFAVVNSPSFDAIAKNCYNISCSSVLLLWCYIEQGNSETRKIIKVFGCTIEARRVEVMTLVGDCLKNSVEQIGFKSFTEKKNRGEKGEVRRNSVAWKEAAIGECRFRGFMKR